MSDVRGAASGKTVLLLCVAAASTALVGTACSRSDRSTDAPHAASAAVARPGERGIDAVERTGEGVRLAADTRGQGGGTGDTGAHAPDNTGVNVRDRGGDTLTPMDQAENTADRTVTQQIRQAIVGDNSLSTEAHNVKIITVDGVVTLRGPVKSEQERSAIVAEANQVPGVKRLEDQLDVAGRD